MSEFAPPAGPPPPKVPEGWKAVWNEQYKEWFYVNLHTKQSTWEKPTESAPNPNSSHDNAAPPSYMSGSTAPHDISDTKNPLDSNNPYHNNNNSSSHTETDEQMARRLQAEEDARLGRGGSGAHSPYPGDKDRGAADSYYDASTGGSNQPYHQQPPGIQGGYPGGPQQGSSSSPYPQAQSQSSDRGLLSKLKNKFGGAGGSRPPQGYPQQQPPYGGGYGGYPPPQQAYGGYGGGYPPQQAMYGQPARKKPGMGAGGAAALGVGGGLIGGMLLADAIDDHDDHEYQEGYQDGQMDNGGYDDGGDFGGGDF